MDRVFTIGGAHAIGRRVPVPRLIHVRAHPIGHSKIFSGLQTHVFELCSRAGLRNGTSSGHSSLTDGSDLYEKAGRCAVELARSTGRSDHRVPRGAGLHVRRLEEDLRASKGLRLRGKSGKGRTDPSRQDQEALKPPAFDARSTTRRQLPGGRDSAGCRALSV